MRYRSHNNLIRYFIEPHDQLPEAYLGVTWYQWWLDCEYKHYNTGGDFGGGLF